MPFCLGTALPSSGSISLNQIHVESGGTSGTTINFNTQKIRNLTGFKKNSAGAKSFSQCRGAFMDGLPAAVSPTTPTNNDDIGVRDDTVVGQNGASRGYFQGRPYIDAGTITIGANTSLVIRYYAAADWEDEGEGDFDFSFAIMAVAPGYTGGCTLSHNDSLGDVSGTSGKCRVVKTGSGSEASTGSIENELGTGELRFDRTSQYPWGITVD